MNLKRKTIKTCNYVENNYDPAILRLDTFQIILSSDISSGSENLGSPKHFDQHTRKITLHYQNYQNQENFEIPKLAVS